jgi:uncharacterized membrane protein
MTTANSFLLGVSDAFSGLRNYLGRVSILFIVLLIIIVLVLAINYNYRKNKALNYLPGIISFVVGLLILLLNIGNLMDTNNLAKLEMIIIFLSAGLCGIVFAKLLSVIKKSNVKNKKSKAKTKVSGSESK